MEVANEIRDDRTWFESPSPDSFSKTMTKIIVWAEMSKDDRLNIRQAVQIEIEDSGLSAIEKDQLINDKTRRAFEDLVKWGWYESPFRE